MAETRGFERDTDGAPLFRRTGQKLKTLTRRADHLKAQLESWPEEKSGKSWVLDEESALRHAIAALHFHRAEMDGLPTVVTALEALVEELEAFRDGEYWTPGLDSQLDSAKKVLLGWARA